MALISASQLSPDEQREADLDAAYSGTKAAIAGFKPVRRVTALVVDILRRANNFFITGPRGFEAVGIDAKKLHVILSPTINDKPNPQFDPSKAGAIVPKIAEVIALLTCSEDDMDACDEDLSNLNRLRRNVMKERDMNEIMMAMSDVQAEFTKINRSTAVVESEKSPVGTVDAKKKQGHHFEQVT